MTVAAHIGELVVAASAGAPSLGGGTPVEVPFLRLALGLLLGTILTLFAAVALKRFLHGRPSLPASLNALVHAGPRTIRVLETHRLSAHADVCLFTIEDRRFVVVVSPGGATLISEGGESQTGEPDAT